MPPRRWPEAVLFDLDGTLADSLPDIGGSLNALMRERGLPPFCASDIRLMVGGGVPKLVERALRARKEPAEADDIAALAKRFLAIYTPRSARLTKLFPGAETLLRGLQGQGIALGVVTNKPEAVTRSMLKALGLAGMIGAVVGGDTLPVKKPDPQPMLAALETLGSTPERSVMIGDSAVDAEAARAAGMALILVTFGYTRTPVTELRADAVVDSFAEVPKVLDALRS
jgi:phosphoglycolate phosphatase